ncbi:hypothetical protein HAX54_012745 [Datura stramonium]|uniref:Disease resistance protein winged helix domain-containing protein n=1 Tax=Datura stramonium TaxID=4076 RepID=A0ABS8TLU6_DATST|nr:hypothetical protein [Datura stramonium]
MAHVSSELTNTPRMTEEVERVTFHSRAIGESPTLTRLSTDVLADQLRKILLPKRYLILVDSVWESKPRLLNDDESWKLLKQKVFGEECCSDILSNIGQEIANKCRGLPLSIVLVAEGYIKVMMRRVWDIAEGYLENLIGRNLVTVAKWSSGGKVKTCRIHDLLLYFCKERAEEKNLLLWMKREDNNKGSFSIAQFSTFTSRFLKVLNLEFIVIDSFPTELVYLSVETPNLRKLRCSFVGWGYPSHVMRSLTRLEERSIFQWILVEVLHQLPPNLKKLTLSTLPCIGFNQALQCFQTFSQPWSSGKHKLKRCRIMISRSSSTSRNMMPHSSNTIWKLVM